LKPEFFFADFCFSLREGKNGVGTSECCVVARGTTTPTIPVLLTVTGTTQTTVTTTLVFVLFGVWLRLFFTVRTGQWELAGRTEIEAKIFVHKNFCLNKNPDRLR
jgi:hypothetical protein